MRYKAIMQRLLFPLVAAGLLLLAACSPVAATLPPGRFTPPDWIKGTWRFYAATPTTNITVRTPRELHFTDTNIFIHSSAPGVVEDLSVTWQDWTIEENKPASPWGYEVLALGDFLADGKTRAHKGRVRFIYRHQPTDSLLFGSSPTGGNFEDVGIYIFVSKRP